MDLMTVYTDDGILDHDAVKANRDLRAQAQSMIAEESTKFKIYSYRAVELQHEIVDQVNIIDTCLTVANNEPIEKRLTFEEIVTLRQTLLKRINKTLYYKYGDKFKEVRAWL